MFLLVSSQIRSLIETSLANTKCCKSPELIGKVGIKGKHLSQLLLRGLTNLVLAEFLSVKTAVLLDLPALIPPASCSVVGEDPPLQHYAASCCLLPYFLFRAARSNTLSHRFKPVWGWIGRAVRGSAPRHLSSAPCVLKHCRHPLGLCPGLWYQWREECRILLKPSISKSDLEHFSRNCSFYPSLGLVGPFFLTLKLLLSP